jgi:hypothetical protein
MRSLIRRIKVYGEARKEARLAEYTLEIMLDMLNHGFADVTFTHEELGYPIVSGIRPEDGKRLFVQLSPQRTIWRTWSHCGVPTCPCQDGDACSYKRVGDSPAWTQPEVTR